LPTTNPPPSPCGPEDALALEAVEALLRLTRAIGAQSGEESPSPALGQWIFQRGRLLEEMGRLSPEVLSEPVRQHVLTTLDACRELDATVESALNTCRTNLEAQLGGLRGTRSLLGKYRSGDPADPPGTRNRDA
jgi:hypothetical protein